MKGNNDSGYTMSDIEQMKAEVDAIVAETKHHLLVRYTPEMDEVLLHARKVGMYWPELSKFWKSKGWPGAAEQTLRRRYRELTNAKQG